MFSILTHSVIQALLVEYTCTLLVEFARTHWLAVHNMLNTSQKYCYNSFDY